NGAGMEPWLEHVRQIIEAGGGPTLVDASIKADPLHMEAVIFDVAGDNDHEDAGYDEHHNTDAHDTGMTDPHLTLDPQRAMRQVEVIRDALSAVDPDGTDYYVQTSAAYLERLAGLDECFRQALGRCAHDEFVVQHAAFGYIADAYGLKQVVLSGLTG